MFGWNYKMKVVNPEKNIIKLSPTLGTWIKAFAPTLVLAALFGVATLFVDNDKPLIDINSLTKDDPDDEK